MNQSIKQTCSNTGCGKQFLVIAAEQAFYKKKDLPLPTHCPTCRHTHRMALRGERQMYNRECAKCHQKILSVYPSTAPHTIYCQPCFWRHIG